MARACRDHVLDTGPKDIIGHYGSDKSSPFDRMDRYGTWLVTAGENIAYGSSDAKAILTQLIIDDGVPGRGHRTNIFNPEFLALGSFTGFHKTYKIQTCIDFAGAFEDNAAAICGSTCGYFGGECTSTCVKNPDAPKNGVKPVEVPAAPKEP